MHPRLQTKEEVGNGQINDFQRGSMTWRKHKHLSRTRRGAAVSAANMAAKGSGPCPLWWWLLGSVPLPEKTVRFVSDRLDAVALSRMLCTFTTFSFYVGWSGAEMGSYMFPTSHPSLTVLLCLHVGVEFLTLHPRFSP